RQPQDALRAFASSRVGIFLTELGMYSKARRVHERGRRVATAQDAKAFAGMTWNNIGETYRGQGRWREALNSYRSAHDQLSASGATHLAVIANCNAASVLIKSGHYEAARAQLRNQLALPRHSRFVDSTYELLNVWALLFLLTGRS